MQESTIEERLSDWRTRFAKAKALVEGELHALAVQTIARDSILLPLAGHRRFWRGPMQDADLVAFLAAALPDDGVFLDIGANIGVYSAALARAKRGRLRGAAFEPVPATFEILERTLRLNRMHGFVAEKIAIGDREGELLLSAYPGGANNFVVGGGAPAAVPSVTVRSVKLDDWIAAHPALVPNAMKIDVEGHELAVLEGALGTLRVRRPTLVIECHCASWSALRVSAEKVTGVLAEAGYRNIRDRDGSPACLARATETVQVLCAA